MKKFFKLQRFIDWLQYDWEHHRFRFFMETIGTFFMFLFMVLFAWYGNTMNVVILLLIEIAGCACHTINGWLRESMNLIILNIVAILVSIFGIIKYYWM